LLQRLFLGAGTRQVLTVHWRLSQFQSPVSPLLLRVPSFQLPPEPFRTQAPPAKVSSLFAASPKASISAIGTQPTACSALRLSQPLGGFLRLRFRGLIPSRSHVQGFLFKGFSLRAATLLRQEGISPLPLERKTAANCRWRHRSTPPTSRPYSTRGCVLPERGLAAPSVAPFLSFRLPRAFPVRAVSLVPQAIRSWRFPMKCSLARSLHWVAFSVLPARKSACLSPGCRPAQGSEPSANFR